MLSSSKGDTCHTLVKYWTYFIVMPLTFVVTNILVSMLDSEHKGVGYGKFSCYINSENMVAFTFGLPIGCVIVINLLMFASAIRKLMKMPKLKNEK